MNRNQRTVGFALSIVMGATLGLAGTSSVFADPSADPSSAKSLTFSLADLDLSRPADIDTARERIHRVARTLCGQVEDMLSMSHQPDFVACIEDATSKAEPRLQKLAAAAAAAGTSRVANLRN
jgi:UrcA family protein